MNPDIRERAAEIVAEFSKNAEGGEDAFKDEIQKLRNLSRIRTIRDFEKAFQCLLNMNGSSSEFKEEFKDEIEFFKDILCQLPEITGGKDVSFTWLAKKISEGKKEKWKGIFTEFDCKKAIRVILKDKDTKILIRKSNDKLAFNPRNTLSQKKDNKDLGLF
ncbi:MAG: hypothetical protein HYW70_01475 [Candidatus Nealsonbacteria bacterium]|nr:hypothetical protein [Candidatus Nealsonbacteria bacterium]